MITIVWVKNLSTRRDILYPEKEWIRWCYLSEHTQTYYQYFLENHEKINVCIPPTSRTFYSTPCLSFFWFVALEPKNKMNGILNSVHHQKRAIYRRQFLTAPLETSEHNSDLQKNQALLVLP